MRTIETLSGAIYEFDGSRVRRVNPEHSKRGDGDWQRLIEPIPNRSVVGERLRIVMASPHRYGPDDEGNVYEPSPAPTIRVTTPVVSDMWESAA